ncbi:hypothetical protein ACTHOQ_13985 [Solibacillus silvestris]|uniref:hypothetical protein n=1 Tax=Solibacillus silvestris TaxID=76853 RepID=UPI003F7D8971
MKKLENAILRNAQKNYRENNSLTSYFIFPVGEENEARSALDNLYAEGYIERPNKALNTSYVTLTEYGVDFVNDL